MFVSIPVRLLECSARTFLLCVVAVTVVDEVCLMVRCLTCLATGRILRRVISFPQLACEYIE